MLKLIKFALITLLTLIVCACGLAYYSFTGSLPVLDGQKSSVEITYPGTIARDRLGHAVITAQTNEDTAYLLGYAHAQDRLFQMDTQRRAASGRLSEIVGAATIEIDKQTRFFQFEARANEIIKLLPESQRNLLAHYSAGVNDAVDELSFLPFEYLLTQSTFEPWQPKDSLLVIYSMYLDLQLGQVNRDLAFTRIAHHFGRNMVDFILQPSHHQAALDGSRVVDSAQVPRLPQQVARSRHILEEPLDIGSNNWAVSGQLTDSTSAMLANDMHLSLRVPIIWYRTQLNYVEGDEQISVTGVSLPGIPGVVVGTNGYIAWGFTNANLDNTDWIELNNDTDIEPVTAVIQVANADPIEIELQQSQFGPVRTVEGINYALRWAALQPYATNLNLVQLARTKSVKDALSVASGFGIPVQNLMLADSAGSIAWTPAGAVSARKTPSNLALNEKDYDDNWRHFETELPYVVNPANHRLWTANARVISSHDLKRFGDGGYAIGARGEQIRDRLFEHNSFGESDFYAIQLDNEARFLIPWHALLYKTLASHKDVHPIALEHVQNWRSCACPDSVGYTLVRRFRSQVISELFDPIATKLSAEHVRFTPIMRHIEPSTWDVLNQKPDDWLPPGHGSWDAFLLGAFEQSLTSLKAEFGNNANLQQLAWGEVNRLAVKHPLSSVIPFIGTRLNMPTQAGYGDSYMPAVQAPRFGASQRLFVRPGDLDKAILTLPGGQSAHPLSPFYTAGFSDYIQHNATPLLPQEIVHELHFYPQE
ncbi:penicillin acylase family protein [Alteromonas sediminis]|uniref:Penicillin acylase family protein n=1 Tax=Alteromonas sediminis TaxID=2259342 RepID=A0A3N5YNL3_9ALTE|nr:penicillin acylase family protein [Alteromonas sediminis]RPJ67251.1 penicillin acylase family protein [Alteromonas sediminis]